MTRCGVLSITYIVIASTAFANIETYPAIDSTIVDFLDINCYECHNDVEKKGGLDLSNLPFSP